MSKFSSGDAALYGFSLFSRAPLTVVGVTLLISFLIVINLGLNFGPTLYLAEYQHSAGALNWEMSDIAWLEGLGPFLIIGLIGVSFLGVFGEAIMRAAILRPLTVERFGGWILGLKFGMDELRVFITMIFQIVLAFAGLIAWAFAVALTLGVLGALAGGLDDLSGGAGIAMTLFAVTGGLALLYVSVRLSPMVAATVGEKRFVLLEAWAMTRGRFWSIFGAYILAFLLAMVVALAVYSVAAMVLLGFGAGLSLGLQDFDFETFSWPDWGLGAAVIGGLFLGFVALVAQLPVFGVGAYVYRHWAADET